MYRIQTLNKISPAGLSKLPEGKYEYGDGMENPAGIILRSFKMHDMELPESLLAVARAGAGTNNIPVDKCADKGIVVFNTPGANANGVKELVLMALFITSRKVYKAMEWVQTIKGKGDEVAKIVEKEKSKYAGQEIMGKTLGVIGLGAIGAMVANDALSLGMDVIGYDPFLSVDGALNLSNCIEKTESLEELFKKSDYISIHVPLMDTTKGFIGEKNLAFAKDGVKILNFSRGGLVDDTALIKAIESGKVGCYVTDFPNDELLGVDNILCIPHLGASTGESEENCAVMAVDQLIEYLEKGNIKNSVNFPACSLPWSGKNRLCVTCRNSSDLVHSISSCLSGANMSVTGMISNNRGDYAYVIIDVEEEIGDSIVSKINAIDDVIKTRVIS